ncbi:MAG: iron-containing alcohol dehydrogenase [Albidovulum sp.]|nr:iron-containing alcohol dehydrogenase [Albidovulum sp.]MDE0532124.1 iron-containing alcohol dehydrogenase [Albidovulum sp.]
MSLIQYLTRIQFGFGAISLLGDEVRRLGANRPLVITDRGVANAGVLDRVLAYVESDRLVVYDRTTENPNENSLNDCLEIWSDEKCDCAIAVGGGSAIDLSKAVALISSHGGTFAEYDVNTGGSAGIGRVSPHIAIPTAAGTGAEVGRACALALDCGRKSVAVNLNMVADCVICDPELSESLPPLLTAATGVDALSHGIEAYLSNLENPPADAIALDCVSRAANWLRTAADDGQDRTARWNMMMAALEGGMVLQKGLGGAHAMATPLEEIGLHHGTLIAVLLPHALRFNATAADERIAAIENAVGAQEPLFAWVERLVADLELPNRLRELGVKRKDLENFARKASKSHLSKTNPRAANEDDYRSLLEAAF